jgi:hypothetical protein
MTGPAPEAPQQQQNPPAEGVTPDPAAEAPPEVSKAVTADDLARVQAALEKERDQHKQAKQQLSQLTQAQRAAMDEGERKILEARESAAAEVRREYGTRLAHTEFKAAAVARNAGYDVDKALAYVDLTKFVGEDGEPDTKAIKAAVSDLVPQASTTEPPPSFDGGSRQTSSGGPSMTQLIRQAAGRA